MRNQKLGYRQIEMTYIIENIVYLELLRRNYQVDIGKNKESEIDFVVRTHNDLYYIQVSLSIENKETKERELKAFKEKGYKMLNLYDFLLDDNSLENI